MADFNLLHTVWSVPHDMMNLASGHNLKQVNGVTNYRGVTLDLGSVHQEKNCSHEI